MAFYTVATQVVISPILNTPNLLLPQDLCSCCPSHSLVFRSNNFSLKMFFLTSGALTLLSNLAICLSPFHSSIYLLYSRFHQWIPFCWFFSLLIFCFSSFIESEFCESRKWGCLNFHWILRSRPVLGSYQILCKLLWNEWLMTEWMHSD